MNCLKCGVEIIGGVNERITYGNNGKAYFRKTCRKCINRNDSIKLMKKRKIVGSNAWYWRKYCRLKANAKKRGIPFSLSMDGLKKAMSEKNCYFCGATDFAKSIDRLDNDLGYTNKNIRMSCLECNVLKRDIVPAQKERMLNILEKL